jgi:hypothetical protein
VIRLFLVVSLFCSCGKERTSVIFSSNIESEYQQKIWQLEQNKKDDLFLCESEEERQLVYNKYEILSEILSHEMAELKGSKKNTPVTMWARGNSHYVFNQFDGETKVIYHKSEMAVAKQVKADFGDLYIGLDKKNKGKGNFSSATPPWSGHWYPVTGGSLYKGDESPLRKLDRLAALMGRTTHIADAEEMRFVNYYPEAYEGYCDGWSKASSNPNIKEPTKTKNIKGIIFYPSDQKAYLTYGHTMWPHKMYGIPYRGSEATDGTHQDIRPELFHRIVEKMLGEERRAIVVDVASGPETWNKPLELYDYKIQIDPKYPKYGILVTATAYYKEQRQKETNEPTTKLENVVPTYTYRLYLDRKSPMKDGKFRVIAGRWIGESKQAHPDTVMIPAKDGELKSHNKEFNDNLDLVKSILF